MAALQLSGLLKHKIAGMVTFGAGKAAIQPQQKCWGFLHTKHTSVIRIVSGKGLKILMSSRFLSEAHTTTDRTRP